MSGHSISKIGTHVFSPQIYFHTYNPPLLGGGQKARNSAGSIPPLRKAPAGALAEREAEVPVAALLVEVHAGGARDPCGQGAELNRNVSAGLGNLWVISG